MRYENNLVVIGAGSAGLIAALVAATAKARVTLVEGGAMGGDCLNTGCVPSKTLIASAKAAHLLSHGERYGLKNVAGEVDFAKVMARVRNAIATIAPKDSMERYESLGVRCIAERATVVDGHTVEVGDARLTTRRIVVAAGAEPFVPPIPGIAGVDILTSDNVWDLAELPGRLAVLGGGPIGCELAQAFARLGSRVALVDLENRLLPREDPDASAVVEAVLAEEGVEILTGHRAARDGAVDVVKRMRRNLVVDALGRRVGRAQPDPGDFGIGVDCPGHARIVAPEPVEGRDQRVDRRVPGLVGGHVRELVGADDVAAGVDRGRGGAQCAVDDERPVRVGFDARAFEPETHAACTSSHGDKNPVEGDALARFFRGVQGDHAGIDRRHAPEKPSAATAASSVAAPG